MKKIFLTMLLALVSVVGAWAQDYLNFTAVGGDVTIGMSKNGSPAGITLQYSTDKANWQTKSLSATGEIITLAQGQTVYLANGTNTPISSLATNNSNYWTFTMTGNGTVEAGGNVMSLLDKTCQTTTMGSYAFFRLFSNCAKLTKAPKLPAMTLSGSCYRAMFQYCTGLTEMPQLPATQLASYCYWYMFDGCTNLSVTHPLPATGALPDHSYGRIFNNCKKVTSVTVNFTDATATQCLSAWLSGTAENTTGILNSPDEIVGKASLPANWQYKQKVDYIAAVREAAQGADIDNLESIINGYIDRINAAADNAAAVAVRDEAISFFTEPTSLAFTFTESSMPVETQHTLEGLEMTFSEDGEEMNLTVNGTTVKYDLDNVGELVHFRGTPAVSLHANQDPDHAGNFYTTFYSGLEAYTLPEGVKAYTAEVEDSGNETVVRLATVTGNILPQGEAVLLYSDELQDGNWTMTVTDPSSATKSTSNQFCGVDVATAQEAANYYMLSYGQNQLGFYKMNADMPLSPNKAFLTTSASVKAIRMVFEDTPFGTTGLENIKETGDGADIYNLQGIRQNRFQKGINIVNGKKIIVK